MKNDNTLEPGLDLATNSELHFRNLIANSLIGVVTSSMDGTLIFVNQAMANMLEYNSPQEMQALDFASPWHRPDLRLQFNKKLKQQGYVSNFEMDAITRTGKIIPVLISANLHGNVISSMVTNISAQKSAEQALLHTNEQFRATFEQAAVGIAHASIDGRFLRINNTFCDIVGYSKDEMLQMNFQQITHPDDLDEDNKQIKYLLSGEHGTYSREKRYICKNQETVWVNLSVSLIRGTSDREDWLMGVVQDISVRKRAEQTVLDYQKKLKALASDLALTEVRERRIIASELHDNVGQSLALSRLQLAAAIKACSGCRKAAALNEISDAIKLSIRDTRSIISDLSYPVMNELGLIAAVSEWLKSPAVERFGLEAELIVDGKPLTLEPDTMAILFRNIRELLINIFKHACASKISVRMHWATDKLEIIVDDNGIGFTAETWSERTPDGESFGLLSINELMSGLGGSFQINNRNGGGVRARMTVPLRLNC